MSSDALAQDCAARGMRWAFGIPGGGPSLQFIDGLTRAGVNYLTTGHETTAGLMAGAAARASGGPSAAVVIKGPGLMNLAPALLSNAYEGYPMLSVAEAYAGGAPGVRRHKWLDQRALVAPIAKGYGYIGADPAVIGQAWTRATAEFPGPVHLELANGEGLPAADATTPGDDVAGAVAKVRAAARPALIVGSWGLRAPWRSRLAQLSIPVFSTVAAKGVIDEKSAHAAGIYTGDGKAITPEKHVLPAADLVVTLGVRAGEILDPKSPGASCIRVDSSVVRRGGIFPPQADANDVLYLDDTSVTALLDALAEKNWGADECKRAVTAMDRALDECDWCPVQAYRRMSETLPDITHVLDTGNFTVVGEHVLRAQSEHDVLGTPNGRYMGLGIGYALGTAIARPDRPVALWIGDGGIRAFFSELHLAVEHRLNLLVMVMADGYFGSIRGRAVQQGWTVAPLRMEGRDLRRAADAMGFSTLAASNETSLSDALAAWRRNPAPTLIRCDFDGETYGNSAGLLR